MANINERKFIPAIFVQDEINLNRRWTSLLGIRTDYHDEHRFIFSPRLNLKFKPKTYTTFRLNAGTGFRLVNLFTEDHAFLTGSREVLVVEDLKPDLIQVLFVLPFQLVIRGHPNQIFFLQSILS